MKRGLLLASAGILAIAVAPGAFAQTDTRPSSSEAQAPSRQTDAQDQMSEEIVVTAQKRAERLVDVPLSITAIGADEIAARRLVNAEDYLRGVPGVAQYEGFTGQSITIRGMETSPYYQNFFNGTTTATYFGETPTTNTAGVGGGTNVDIKLVDIERVEVLRGPQGTAFGSSSMGGTVRAIPAAPRTDAFEGQVRAGISQTARFGSTNYLGQAVVNVPIITDKLAIRGVVYRFDDSGYYRNRSLSNPTFVTTAQARNATAFLTDKDDIGAYRVTGGRIAALFKPVDAFKLTLSYLRQSNRTDGSPVATTGTYEQAGFTLAPQHIIRDQSLGRNDMDISILNTTAEYDFGPVNLFATYSHTNSKAGISFAQTIAFGNDRPWSQDATSRHYEDVGEVRLSTKFDGRLNFLAGLYGEKLRDRALFDNIWFGSGNLFGTNPAIGTRDDRRELRQWAAFGEVYWEPIDGLTLTGGIRHYDFKRDFDLDTIGQAYNGAALASTHVITQRTAKAAGETYRANVRYKPSANSSLYASYSQGFRLGQAQLGLPAGTCDLNNDGLVDGTNVSIASTQAVGSDTVENFEAGGKFDSSNRRFSASASVFHMKWKDLPFNVNPGSTAPGCALAYVANVASAVSNGVELEFSLRPLDGLRFDFSGSYNDAKLAEAKPAPQPAPKGSRLPGAPRLTGHAGAEYRFERSPLQPSIRLDATYVGSFYGEIQDLPASKTNSYVKLDLTGRMEFNGFDVMVYVNNLTNNDAFTFRNAGAAPVTYAPVIPFYGYRLRPRTIGLQVGYKF